ncbi:MAG: transcriptional repressor [Fidelibacterota bacterium]|nr:MAG: transcriptional repressor [Candidatus Neomarinimicrobiota bacterium]
MNEHQTRLEEVIAKLRANGHRLTPQRMAVLKVLVRDREHLNVEQIYEHVKADFPMTSLATIYKTVNVLKEMGEVMELGFHDDCARFDGNPCPHPHLICINCKKIMDIDIDDLDELPREVARRKGYQIISHRFEFYGICPRCQETSN